MKSPLRWLLAATILLAPSLSFGQSQAKKPDPKFFIYLCFGQSNMEAGARPAPQDLGTLDPRFQMLAAVDMPRMNRKMGEWYLAMPPLNRPENNLGPVDFFGRNMVASLPPEYRVGVINVSLAGAKIELWDKDTSKAYLGTAPKWLQNMANLYGGSPYQRLVEMGKIAQKEGVIKGILIHQGESNATDKEWPEKVKKIYDDLITDLHLDPDQVPLLAGELKSKEQHGVCASFNTEILPGLQMALRNSYIISSKDCEGLRDPFHFTTAGFRELGKRYAKQMLELEGFQLKETDRPGLIDKPADAPVPSPAPAAN